MTPETFSISGTELEQLKITQVFYNYSIFVASNVLFSFYSKEAGGLRISGGCLERKKKKEKGCPQAVAPLVRNMSVCGLEKKWFFLFFFCLENREKENG